MKKTVLRDVFAQWGEADAFDRVSRLSGTTVRDKEGRRTLRFQYEGRTFYLKHHRGVGWGEILKNLSQFKAPVIGACNEWLAINKLQQLGVHTLNPVAYGRRGWNPARRESFLITEELSGTISLAKYAENWPVNPPGFREKKRLIEKVADIAGTIHRHGMNHRDLYICHFLLDLAARKAGEIRLYLVDLHRAQLRQSVPFRWQVKDLGSIYFSAADIGLTVRDVMRFLRVYFRQDLRRIFAEHRVLLHASRRRAVRLYERDFGRQPELVL